VVDFSIVHPVRATPRPTPDILSGQGISRTTRARAWNPGPEYLQGLIVLPSHSIRQKYSKNTGIGVEMSRYFRIPAAGR